MRCIAPIFAIFLLGCQNEEESSTETSSTTSSSITTEYPSVAWDGWEVIDTDIDTYADYGYIIQTWEVGPSADNYFQSNLGTERRFYLMRPETISADAPELPLLTMLHGGTVDHDEREEYYDVEDPFDTKCGAAREVAPSFIAEKNLVPFIAAEREWAIAVPENLWCDFWFGRGPDDPVDPVHHRGYEHTAEVLDFLQEGGGGFLPSQQYLWGSSAGATGTITTAIWNQRFDGVIADSPPCDMLLYYPDDSKSLEHMFGGPPYEEDGVTPSEWYSNYTDVSCNLIMASGEFGTPIYLAWNMRDILAMSYSQVTMSEAMEATLPEQGVRFGHHDWDHNSPGATYHAQTRNATGPLSYISELMVRFLEGKTIYWAEAEEGCGGKKELCAVGEKVFDAPNDDPIWVEYSLGGGIITQEAGGEGVAYTGFLPEGISAGESVTATVLTMFEGHEDYDDEARAMTITWTEEDGSEVQTSVEIGDLMAAAAMLPLHADNMMHHHASTEVTFTPSTTGGRLSVYYSGRGTMRIDAVVYQQ